MFVFGVTRGKLCHLLFFHIFNVYAAYYEFNTEGPSHFCIWGILAYLDSWDSAITPNVC